VASEPTAAPNSSTESAPVAILGLSAEQVWRLMSLIDPPEGGHEKLSG